MADFSSLAQLVQHFENPAGDPTLAPSYPNSHPSGLYQFQPATWLQYAPAAGVDTSQYPTAGTAPADVQTSVFQQAVAANGLGDWTCQGCNPGLGSYLAANPSAYNLPVTAAGTGSATTPTATPASASGATTAPPAAPASAGAGFYIIAIVLVVFLLAAGMWGLIKG